MSFIFIFLGNFIVGGLVGISGIAGFLLPMMYVGGLGFTVSESLALSFFAFVISGAVGAFNFYLKGNADVSLSLRLGIGSIAGSILGVILQSMIQQNLAKTLLYLVVFGSGCSILFRKNQNGKQTTPHILLESNIFVFSLGFITATICSLSGAGGPILVMPLLVSLGVPIHLAIGIALLDSIFIATPAFIGYMIQVMNQSNKNLPLLLTIVLLSHGLGVLLGSKHSHKIKQHLLKKCVAIFSILLSIYMICGLFL